MGFMNSLKPLGKEAVLYNDRNIFMWQNILDGLENNVTNISWFSKNVKKKITQIIKKNRPN